MTEITTPEAFATNMAKAQRHLLSTNLLRAGVMPSQLAGVIAEIEDSLWLAVTLQAAVIDETTALAASAAEVERLREGIEALDLDVLEDVAFNLGHTVYEATATDPAECTDECEACCIEDTVTRLRALPAGTR